jgi:tRNA threonylcarbamoyladenosine biosynthesis protein TsaB
MMRVLVIDTALGLCTAGVVEVGGDDARVLGLRSEVMLRGHSERLAGLARDAVADTDGGFGAIDRIGVTVGPGSFTGLRVGLAFAQGLGAALDRPVVGVSTLDALAASIAAAPAVMALIDARRGQVYGRLWRDGAATAAPAAWTLEETRGLIERMGAPGLIHLTGSGLNLVAEAGEGVRLHPLDGPDPVALARLAASADPALAPPRPLYLRAPDATPPTRLPGQARASVAAP